MTQADLADKLHVSESAVQKWVSNKNSVPADKIMSVSALLNISSLRFLEENDAMNANMVLNEKELLKLRTLRNGMSQLICDKRFRRHCNDLGTVYLEHPAHTFSNGAKGGAFDDFSDEDYAAMLQVVYENEELFKRSNVDCFNYTDGMHNLMRALESSLQLLDRLIAQSVFLEKMEY